MESSPHSYKQTKEWEDACIKTRRNLGKREKRILRFGIKKNDKVLDLGCGDGLNITIFARLGVKNVVGVDISKNLLKIAKKFNPNSEFFIGSAEKLPFKDNVFDVVFVDSVFHHLLDYKEAVQEIKRVLKPGGFLCFIEPHKSLARSILDLVSIFPLSKFLPVLRERREAYLGEIDLMKHWLATEEEFFQTLSEHKFRKVIRKNDFLSVLGKYKKP